jgi:biofilm protein TabA
MISDTIKYLSTYSAINSNVQAVIEFLQNNALENLVPGKHLIDETNCFVLIFEYDTKKEEEALWEAHRKYLDLHLMVSGRETIFVQNISRATSSKPYDSDNDYELFQASGTPLVLEPDSFVILHPQDVHKTSVNTSGSGRVKKAVFKLKI